MQNSNTNKPSRAAIAALLIFNFSLLIFNSQAQTNTETLLSPAWTTTTANLNTIIDFSVTDTKGDTIIFNLSNKIVGTNNSDIYLEAINAATGTVLYTRTIGGLANLPDYGSAIKFNAADNSIYIAGSLIDTIAHGLDIFVARINATTGGTIWQRKINGSAAYSFDVAA